MSRARGWILVWNNPPERVPWKELPDKVSFMTWQYEIGEQEGTPHLQGVVQFKNSISLQAAKKALGSKKISLHVKRGKWDRAIEYANKEHTRVDGPWTYGERPHQGSRTDLEAVKEDLDNGMSMVDIADKHFHQWCRFEKAFTKYQRMKWTGRSDDDPMHIWVLTGPPGYGKSHYARKTIVPQYEQLHGFYCKPAVTKWWDKYETQEIVLFDDFGGGWFPWTQLMQLLDIYSGVQVEAKHDSFVPWNAKVVIITSNQEPEEWYDAKHPVAALLRRITHHLRWVSPRMPVVVKQPE